MVRSIHPSLRLLLAVVLVSAFAATPARAGTFSDPFANIAICGDTAVSASMAATNNFAFSSHCSSLCRAASAQCHAFVVRVSSCLTAWRVTNAGFESRNCDEITNLGSRIACKSSVRANLVSQRASIVAGRDIAFTDCDTWEAACQLNCP
jgi:hypothetical protein